jgi:hypothetical protein
MQSPICDFTLLIKIQISPNKTQKYSEKKGNIQYFQVYESYVLAYKINK